MSDTISRQAAIKDAESWVAVDEYEKHLQKNVVEWLKEFPSAQLSTNLAEVGTDLISRQAAIDALAEDMPSAYTPDGSHPADEGIFMAQEIYADCIQTLKELPSAQPQRIMGRWITDKQGFITWSAICNKCGARIQMLDGYYNFCPNCGVKMEK